MSPHLPFRWLRRNHALGSSLACCLALLLGQGIPLQASTGDAPNADAIIVAPEVEEFSRPLRQTRFLDRVPPKLRDPSDLGEQRLVIPGLERELTQRYIKQYSSAGGVSWLKSVMARGEPYLAFIRREIEERNLPRELVYLPVLESSYLSTAISRSGAAGLWQFMTNSIGPFDMRVTEWMDERMDFWKSTQGALRKLEDNYRVLQDWPLALAAYNAGLGAVTRITRRSGEKDYWRLSEAKLLKSETIHYVPKLLAIAHILSNPRRYGIEPLWNEDPRWTRIRIGKQVDLDLLAEAAGLNGEALKRANRELLFGVTPPEGTYYLKAPASQAHAIEEVLERKDAVLLRYYYHTVKYGDTLLALSLHYGVTVAQIRSANQGVRERALQLGSRLRIPAFKQAEPYARPAAAGNRKFNGYHLVKRGETLWSIALAYNVDPESLAEANGMGLNDTLREGRSLKTPIIQQ